MFDNQTPLEEIQAFFAQDKYAYEQTGCRIVLAQQGHSMTEMEIGPQHRNGFEAVMGGAIFTLADYALAVACNIGEEPTVSVSNTIEFLSSTKGTKLTAECFADRSGRNLGFYTVKVRDDLGKDIAVMTATCYR